MAVETNREQDWDLVRLYLDSIGQYPLLTRHDEVRLSRLIEKGRLAKEELGRAGLHPAKRRRLLCAVRQGDLATEQFVNSNLRLVVSIAKKYQSSELPLLDLVQEGNLGLIHAVGKFDWRKGFKFSTYATWWIRQAIGRGIDNTGRTIRLPVHASDQVRRLLRVKHQFESKTGQTPSLAQLAGALGITEAQAVDLIQHGNEPVSLDSRVGPDGETELGDMVADVSSPSPFDEVTGAMLAGEVQKLLSILDEREREILFLRYGFDHGDPRTLEEVGAALQLTRERIRQIERAALSKLRHPSTKSDTRDLLAS
ncbi:MAG: sigma-70 family RNA polymerase sigma factor [Acidimicrobiales bacterium]